MFNINLPRSYSTIHVVPKMILETENAPKLIQASLQGTLTFLIFYI